MAQLDDFLNPATFNKLPDQIERMDNAIKTSGQFEFQWLCKYEINLFSALFIFNLKQDKIH